MHKESRGQEKENAPYPTMYPRPAVKHVYLNPHCQAKKKSSKQDMDLEKNHS